MNKQQAIVYKDDDGFFFVAKLSEAGKESEGDDALWEPWVEFLGFEKAMDEVEQILNE